MTKRVSNAAKHGPNAAIRGPNAAKRGPNAAKRGPNAASAFLRTYSEYKKLVDVFIDENLPSFDGGGQRILGEAMRYSAAAGGKRIRGALALAVCELLGGDGDAALTLAGAIEYIHAYSLIHDDLPCMDDDDYRRGKPSCHKAYGEGIAVLTGDALLNLAFEILLNSRFAASPGLRFIEAAAYIASAAGARGMAGGQAVDLGGDITDPEDIKHLYRLKTGRLFDAAVLSPAICFDANDGDITALAGYSYEFGQAFQIRDDMTDADAAAGAGDALRSLQVRRDRAAGFMERFSGRNGFMLELLYTVTD